MQKIIPLVSVTMLTYNHEKYIAQAIESVLMQKTDFPFELVIGEDCSTDGTLAIVEAYARKNPEVIRVITDHVNVGALANDVRVNNACRGKYIATLEGDDFWNDVLKLQKQVDFLENNAEYGLIHSDVNHFYEASQTLVKNYNAIHNFQIPEGDIYNELLDPGKYIIKTPTAVFRRELHDQYVDYNIVRAKGWSIADLFTWLSMARFTKVKYLPEALATYRILPDSASNTVDFRKKIKVHRSVYEIRSFFAKRYPCDEVILKKIKTRHVETMLFDAFKTSDQKLAAETRKFARENKIDFGLKNWVLYLGTKSKLFNRSLNLLW